MNCQSMWESNIISEASLSNFFLLYIKFEIFNYRLLFMEHRKIMAMESISLLGRSGTFVFET